MTTKKEYRVTYPGDHLDWLKKQLAGLYNKAERDPSRYGDLGTKLAKTIEYLSNAEEVKPNSKSKQKAQEIKDDWLPKLCKEHPEYTADRPPRIDCEGHWAAYKRLNPMKYEAARRKFERSKNDNQGTTSAIK